MEVVEAPDVVAPDVEQVQELQPVHEQEPSLPSNQHAQQPGSLTKRTRRAKVEHALSGDVADWNRFARDPTTKKPTVEISSYSRQEGKIRRQREKERREIQERNASLMMQRAEEEAARQRQEKERVQAERKAWAQAKLEQRQEKIIRAAEERQKREVAYCHLLEKTRERGLLFERLQAQGEELVASQERQKVEEYKTLLAPAKKIASRDIQQADDLHPSLRALQRVQQQNNIRREAQKAPVAFSPKHVHTGPGGTSPFSSTIGERRMPGGGTLRPDSMRDPSASQRRPGPKLRRPSPTRTCGPCVDRASSPLALPGVEITVHELPSDAREQAVARPSLRASSPPQHGEAEQEQSISAAAVEPRVSDDVAAQAAESAPEESVAAPEEPVASAQEAAPEESVAAALEEEGTSPEDDQSPEEHEEDVKSEEAGDETNDSTTIPDDIPGDLEEDMSSPQQPDNTAQGEVPDAQGAEAEEEEL